MVIVIIYVAITKRQTKKRQYRSVFMIWMRIHTW